jgi:hypothetical protein
MGTESAIKLPGDRKALIELIADELVHPANQYDPAGNPEGALKFHERTAERILRVIAEQSLTPGPCDCGHGTGKPHSEKMEGVIPKEMTFTEYVVRLLARKTKG